MSRADAQWHVANLGDGGVPGRLTDRYLDAAPGGLRYSRAVMVDVWDLDEDDSWTDRTDEIHARAWSVDRNGDYWWGSTSNVVVRNF